MENLLRLLLSNEETVYLKNIILITTYETLERCNVACCHGQPSETYISQIQLPYDHYQDDPSLFEYTSMEIKIEQQSGCVADTLWNRICVGFLLFVYICIVVGDPIIRGIGSS